MFQMIFLLLVLISCSTTQPKIDDNKFYKKDLIISTKDKKVSGVGVFPDKKSFEFKIESPGKLDLLIFRSCSREIVIEKGSHRLDRNEYVINYDRNELEREPACSVEVQAFSVDRVASWGFIDFEDTSATLPALILCGEKEELYNGVSVCQSRLQLIQKIKFNTDVTVETYPGCDKIVSNNGNLTGREFLLELERGECLFVFNTENKFHRLTTYGYDTIFIREQ